VARTVTASDLIERAKTKADLQNSNFVSESEWFDFLNDAYTDLYDTLARARGNYFVAPTGYTFNIGPSTDTYDLPSDFYKLVGVDYAVSVSNNHWVTLKPYTETERNVNSGQTASIPEGTVRLLYTPAPAVIDDLADTIDGVAGYEKIIITDMAISALEKMERDTSNLERRLQRYMATIQDASIERDFGMPGKVSDTTVVGLETHWSTLRYRTYGDKIRFVSTELIVPYFNNIYL
jgi:hypothetical protein